MTEITGKFNDLCLDFEIKEHIEMFSFNVDFSNINEEDSVKLCNIFSYMLKRARIDLGCTDKFRIHNFDVVEVPAKFLFLEIFFKSIICKFLYSKKKSNFFSIIIKNESLLFKYIFNFSEPYVFTMRFLDPGIDDLEDIPDSLYIILNNCSEFVLSESVKNTITNEPLKFEVPENYLIEREVYTFIGKCINIIECDTEDNVELVKECNKKLIENGFKFGEVTDLIAKYVHEKSNT